MTLADFLKDLLNHDTSKQIGVHIEGIDGVFTSVQVDQFESNGTTVILRVTP